MKEHTKTLREGVIDYLEGSSNSAAMAERAFGITEEEVLDICVETGLEQCDCCGWWDRQHYMDNEGGDWLCNTCYGAD